MAKSRKNMRDKRLRASVDPLVTRTSGPDIVRAIARDQSLIRRNFALLLEAIRRSQDQRASDAPVSARSFPPAPLD